MADDTVNLAKQVLSQEQHGPQDQPALRAFLKKQPTNFQSWDDVPTINPQELIGKKVGSLLADLTRAGGTYEGIDSSRTAKPEPMLGGPGYPLMGESQQNKLGWAVQGKGRGTAKLNKDSDYIAVHAMNPTSHLSNASMANAINETMAAYARDKRLAPEAIEELNNLVKTTSGQKEHERLKSFPGFEHPDIEKYLKGLNFESRLRISQLLGQTRSQELGAPNIDKITRDTLDKNFAGVPYGHAMYLLEVPKGSAESLVHLKEAGLPVHPSYDWGIHGRIVGKFAHPVAPELLHKDWFDQKQEENKTKVTPKGKPPNLRRAFELALPTTKITKEIADLLPRSPADIQSGKAAQLALNAFNDQWHDTDTPVNKGGLGSALLSQALKNSDSSSTITQYNPKELNEMIKAGKFTGYKLKDGQVYFGLKRGTNYKEDYGFEHPDLSPNETSLVSVVNNEPGAKGIGGAPVVLKAIQHGATALDAFAVPSKKHPKGFLPDFYKHFGFEVLGHVPFDESYVTPIQLSDMKHEWRKAGWDESLGLPPLAIMKWRGKNEDRADAVRRFVTQGGRGFGSKSNPTNVRSPAGLIRPSTGPGVGGSQRESVLGDTGGNSGPMGADNAPRPSDRFTRTLAAVKNLAPSDVQHFGLNQQDIDLAKSQGLKRGGPVHIRHEEFGVPHFREGGDVDVGQDGIMAYHGSPHDFEQFDTSKIGTGEGAQSYGHGLYFAQAEPTAVGYRDKLAQQHDPRDAINNVIHQFTKGKVAAPTHENIKSWMADNPPLKPFANDERVTRRVHEIINATYPDDAYHSFKELDNLLPDPTKGHMYEVHINAHPHHMLDWDKPLSEQSSHITKSLFAARKEIPTLWKKAQHHINNDSTAGDFYQSIAAGHPHGYAGATEQLSRAGIKGIKYLDAGSRGDKAEPTHNYVVFDHNDVHIKRKYEQGGSVGFDNGGSVHDQFLPHNHPQRQQNLGEFLKESAVKHPDGRPKVVYHNTDRSFSEFHTNQSEMGAHFGTPAQANDILEGKYDQENHQGYPAYLNLKKPLRLRDTGNFKPRNVAYQLQEMGLLEGLGRHVSLEEVQNHIKSLGYDGVVYLNRREGISRTHGKDPERYNDYSDQMFKHHFPDAEDSYIAFDPTQIKSAIGNNGYYDQNEPDITKADGGDVMDDSRVKRTGEGGQESALDFIQNTPLYKQRMEDQKQPQPQAAPAPAPQTESKPMPVIAAPPPAIIRAAEPAPPAPVQQQPQAQGQTGLFHIGTNDIDPNLTVKSAQRIIDASRTMGIDPVFLLPNQSVKKPYAETSKALQKYLDDNGIQYHMPEYEPGDPAHMSHKWVNNFAKTYNNPFIAGDSNSVRLGTWGYGAKGTALVHPDSKAVLGRVGAGSKDIANELDKHLKWYQQNAPQQRSNGGEVDHRVHFPSLSAVYD